MNSSEDLRSKTREDTAAKTAERRLANELSRHQRETLNSLVREQVMHTLGVPDDLLSVHVMPLWETTYRVNVYTGANVAMAKIVHSYFLVTDPDGNIVESTPKIKQQYHRNSP